MKRIGTDKEDQGNDFIEEQLSFSDEPQAEVAPVTTCAEVGGADAPDD